MSMHNLNLLPDNNIAKHGEEGENGRHGRLSIYHEERNMVHFESIGEIPHSSPSFICMGNNDDFVTAIDEFL